MSDATPVLARLTTALADRYRLDRELGAGGMATVYLAYDLRHERDVAIKVLHPDLGAALGGERFLSEIRTTARLQHPHILPLLDSGEADGLLYYVMPLVTGETLRARLERERQLPIADVVRIARDVASALDYAHRQHVIHRDIKPENILLHDGSALVADFGIALAVQSAGGQRMTQTGLSLGTPQYMSPEQAMGERTIDARSDIYALGAVTYEMLVGDAPFTGSSVQAIVAKVLTERPSSPTTVRDTIPPHVEAAVLHALAKLPADRFSSAAEFSAALSVTGVIQGSGARAAGGSATRQRARSVTLWGAMVLVAMTAGVTWLLAQRRSVSPDTDVVTRFSIEGNGTYVSGQRLFAISPDASALVLWRMVDKQQRQLFLRRLDQLEARPIAGSLNAIEPTFSPDGRWIAFAVDRYLYKTSIAGGNPIRIATLRFNPRGIAWMPNGNIVYATQTDSLYVVNENGGPTRALAAAPKGEVANWPVAVGQSNVVLFSVSQRGTGDSVDVRALSINDGTVTDVGTDGYMAVGVARGHLVYVNRTGEIFAAPYDERAHKVMGRGERVGDGVKMSPSGGGLGFVVMSASGSLVYTQESSAGLLMLRDPQGRYTQAVPDTLYFEHPRFSPDMRRLVVTLRDSTTGRTTLSVLDRFTGVFAPLSEQDPQAGRDRAEWTPDGRGILFRSLTDSLRLAKLRTADGSGTDTLLLTARRALFEVVMAPNGNTLLGRIQDDTASFAQGMFWWTRGDSVLRALSHIRSAGTTITGARFSPDGKWIAFTADVPRHVYVAAFPGPGSQVRIDRDGGRSPVWSRDGRSLYYFTPTGLVSTAVDLSSGVKIGTTREHLPAEYTSDDIVHAPFDVGADGSLVFVRQTRFPRLVVVRNFAAEFGRQRSSNE